MVILRVSAKNYCFRFSEAKSCRIEILWKKEIADLISCWNTKKKETISTFYFHCVIRVALVAQAILDHWRTCVQPFVHHCLSFCLCFGSHCIVSLLLRFTASDYYFDAFSYVSKLITNFRL